MLLTVAPRSPLHATAHTCCLRSASCYLALLELQIALLVVAVRSDVSHKRFPSGFPASLSDPAASHPSGLVPVQTRSISQLALFSISSISRPLSPCWLLRHETWLYTP